MRSNAALTSAGEPRPKLDAADLTFVHRLRRHHLERGRKAHARGQFRRFLGALREMGGRDRNSDRIEDLLGLDFR